MTSTRLQTCIPMSERSSRRRSKKGMPTSRRETTRTRAPTLSDSWPSRDGRPREARQARVRSYPCVVEQARGRPLHHRTLSGNEHSNALESGEVASVEGEYRIDTVR